MRRWELALAGAAAVAALATVAVAQVAAPAQVQRQVLQRQDIAGTGREAVIGSAELPPGTAIGRHTHPGEEIGYVLQGPVRMKIDGRPDQLLQTGQSYAIPRGAPHDAEAAGEGGARVAAVWIIDKGAPLSSPAPAAPRP